MSCRCRQEFALPFSNYMSDRIGGARCLGTKYQSRNADHAHCAQPCRRRPCQDRRSPSGRPSRRIRLITNGPGRSRLQGPLLREKSRPATLSANVPICLELTSALPRRLESYRTRHCTQSSIRQAAACRILPGSHGRRTMGTSGLRKCCHCGSWYKPRPRNAWHQRYCGQRECQVVSKHASQRKWCLKNPEHFQGEEHVQRVQAWRRAHPGYWRSKGTAAPRKPPDALQDLLILQGFDRQGVSIFRDCLSDEISRPLQDVLTAQQHALVGLTAMITGEALQDAIAHVLATCYERGRRIGGLMPWMQPQEVIAHAAHP